MKEITFLKQNADKWENFERKMEENVDLHPSELTGIFLEVADDYSYSKTNYPQSKTTSYLNKLVARAHHLVYKNKKESNKRILRFWKTELPQLFGKYQHLLLLSFVISAIGTLIGVVSQYNDDTFVRLILGDNYVNETIERIKRGNALGIYGEMPGYFDFFYIAINNIRVSFLMLAFGMLFSAGAAFLILYNTIMLGSFFTMFYQYNVLGLALKVVWIHGALEISAIVIAGCAGFVLGNSFMFPGTYTRIDAFKSGAKDAIKIVVGLIPVFICAAFLESFITRYTEMSLALSMFIIFGSLTFILWYFVFLPLRLKSKLYAKN